MLAAVKTPALPASRDEILIRSATLWYKNVNLGTKNKKQIGIT